MVEYTPNDRFYFVEGVPELQCEARDKTQREVNPKHAAEAVRTALRWTPDRIIFGEVRYGEVANELIKAWNIGHTGNVTTVYADRCASMLMRMEDLLPAGGSSAGGNLQAGGRRRKAAPTGKTL
jgi:type IV secretion system protein VirB11